MLFIVGQGSGHECDVGNPQVETNGSKTNGVNLSNAQAATENVKSKAQPNQPDEDDEEDDMDEDDMDEDDMDEDDMDEDEEDSEGNSENEPSSSPSAELLGSTSERNACVRTSRNPRPRREAQCSKLSHSINGGKS